MNIQVAGNLEAAEWAFDVGQLVSHRDQPMLAMVMGRTRATNGMEIYGLERLVERAPLLHSMMLAEVLIPVSDQDADGVASAEEVWFDQAEARHMRR